MRVLSDIIEDSHEYGTFVPDFHTFWKIDSEYLGIDIEIEEDVYMTITIFNDVFITFESKNGYVMYRLKKEQLLIQNGLFIL